MFFFRCLLYYLLIIVRQELWIDIYLIVVIYYLLYMLLLLREKSLHWFRNMLRVLEVGLFYMMNYYINGEKLYRSLSFSCILWMKLLL